MGGGSGALFVAVFLACAVEAVEATTIVLAAGHGQGLAVGRDRDGRRRSCCWRSSWPRSARRCPRCRCAALRLVVGRAAADLRPAVAAQGDPAGERVQGAARRGRDLPHAAGRARPRRRGGGSGSVPDWYAFTLSFKGVLLEGLEVVFIALTFGGNAHDIPLAAVAAGCAVRGGRGRGRGGARAAGPGAGEHAEVRRRDHAHRVRHVLGRRGRGRALAGVGRGAAGPGAGHRAVRGRRWSRCCAGGQAGHAGARARGRARGGGRLRWARGCGPSSRSATTS